MKMNSYIQKKEMKRNNTTRYFLAFLFGVAAAAACFGLLLLHVPCPRVLLPAQQELILGRSTNATHAADPSKKLDMAPAPAPGDEKLLELLRRASMEDMHKTVILTFASQAWTAPGSLQDLFLESFRLGDGTTALLKHLVVIADGATAYEHCRLVHPLCYHLEVPAGGVDYVEQQSYMAKGYLEIVWRKFLSQASVLRLGYSFLFTDMDIVWFRNPMLQIPLGVDLAMGVDRYGGDNPYDLDDRKQANTGLMFVRASPRMEAFYESWYAARLSYPNTHEQWVFQKVKDTLPAKHGIRVQFIDTAYVGGFCQLKKDFNKLCTVHAICLQGLKAKQAKLTEIFNEWKEFRKKAGFDLVGSNNTAAPTH